MVNGDVQPEHPGMDTKNRVGLRVRLIRKNRGLTQEQLAELIDRSVDAVSLLERGKIYPSFETLERLSERLGVPLKELVDFREGEDPERVELETALAEAARKLDNRELATAVRQINALVELVADREPG